MGGGGGGGKGVFCSETAQNRAQKNLDHDQTNRNVLKQIINSCNVTRKKNRTEHSNWLNTKPQTR